MSEILTYKSTFEGSVDKTQKSIEKILNVDIGKINVFRFNSSELEQLFPGFNIVHEINQSTIPIHIHAMVLKEDPFNNIYVSTEPTINNLSYALTFFDAAHHVVHLGHRKRVGHDIFYRLPPEEREIIANSVAYMVFMRTNLHFPKKYSHIIPEIENFMAKIKGRGIIEYIDDLARNA